MPVKMICQDAPPPSGIPAHGDGDGWDTLNSPSSPSVYWTTSNVGEAVPGVLTPLGWDLWGPSIEHCMREGPYQLGAISCSERAVPARLEDWWTRSFCARCAVQVSWMAMLGDRMPGTSGEATVTSLFGRVPEGLEFRPTKRRYPVIAWRLPRVFLTAPRRGRALSDEFDHWYRRTVPTIDDLNLGQAVTAFEAAARRFDAAVIAQTLMVLGNVQPLYDALARVVEKAGVGDLSTLSGASGAPEFEVVADIWKASRGRLDITEVVARHGFHGPSEGELSARVWREDDAPLRRIIAQYAERDDGQSPDAHDRRRRLERPRVEQELLSAIPRLQRPSVRLLLKLCAEQLPLRGMVKRSFLQSFDVSRAAARRIGLLLASDGRLDDAEDVFYLRRSELAASGPDARARVALRRERRAAYERLTIPIFWRGTPEPIEDEETPTLGDDAVLTGVGVSGGVVEGKARVVLNPDFADVEPDEVLVAMTTDPSWSSIMFISAALVMDMGGALSHAAVVARELDIPCVVNTRLGTKVLRTGDRVRVDGDRGTVEVLERNDIEEDDHDATA
jgi:rifampicin phosphotransferase